MKSRALYGFMVKMFFFLHSLMYKLGTLSAVKFEGGVHPKHRITGYHQFFLDRIGAEDRVLDIGCGNGLLTQKIAAISDSVIGIDLSQANIEVARLRYSAPNIEFICGDATTYNFSQSFDVAILSNVLEHIKDRRSLLGSLKHIRCLLVRVPLIDRDWTVLYKKELGLEWRLDRTHEIEYTLIGLQDELELAGFEIRRYDIKFGEVWAEVVRGYEEAP